MSDFHKISLTVLKVFYKKQHSNIVRYRNYRNFSNELNMNDVKKSTLQEYYENQFLEIEIFKRKFDCILEKHAITGTRIFKKTNDPVLNAISKYKYYKKQN